MINYQLHVTISETDKGLYFETETLEQTFEIIRMMESYSVEILDYRIMKYESKGA